MTRDEVEYLVVHTSASDHRNCDRDEIDRWHRERGWSGIGYHYVIVDDRHDDFDDGTVQEGRPISRQGAHVLGINGRSVGICCVGHGDLRPHTAAQRENLLRLLSELMDEHPRVIVDRIIGHREVNALVREGVVSDRCRTTKTCPGRKVDMDEIRQQVRGLRSAPVLDEDGTEPPTDRRIRNALKVLRAIPRTTFPNAHDELRSFLLHPEVRALGDER